MTLKQLQEKYPQFTIRKSTSSFGNYQVTLMQNHYEYFFKLKYLDIFLTNHIKDLKNGERL